MMRTRYLLSAVLVGLGITVTSLLILACSNPTVQAGGVIDYYYVREGGMGNCLSVTTPCGSVQQAVDLAAAPGDSFVWVAAGTYTENLVITHSLSMLGGWDASFTTQSPAAYTTTIEGGSATHVVSVAVDVGFLEIDGFTFRNGLDGIHLHGETVRDTPANGGGGVHIIDNTIRGASQQGIEVESGVVFLEGNLIIAVGQEGIKVNDGWVTMSDSTVDGVASHGVLAEGNAITIMDSTIRDVSGDGIDARGMTVVIVGNVVSGCTGIGIEAASADGGVSIAANQVFDSGTGIAVSQASAFTLTNNVVADHAGSGIELQGTGAGVIYHNTLVGSGVEQQGAGITVTVPSITLANNIIVSHTVGITRAAGSTLVVSNTLLWANGSDPISGTAAIERDPLFIAPAAGDYHIWLGSPAINGGVDVGVPCDTDGDPRVGAPDVGADEFVLRHYLPLVSVYNPNSLKNPGFEGITRPGGWTHATHDGQIYDNIFTPEGWVTWWLEEANYDQPEVRVIPNEPPFTVIPRIRSGHYATMLFVFYRLQDMGLYQCVTGLEPGATAQFSAHAHGWSCDSDMPTGYSCGDLWNLTFQVGIGPGDVADPFSSSIVWSTPQNSPDVYSRIGPVAAQVGESGGVCVYLRSQTKWMYKYQDAYWDDAELVVIAPASPTP
jgi:parallel beta-helix repeat protein